MSKSVKFTIWTPSRHPTVQGRDPAVQSGYDPENHRYRPEYVNPAFWTLHLNLRLDGEERPESFEFFLREVDGPLSLTLPTANPEPRGGQS